MFGLGLPEIIVLSLMALGGVAVVVVLVRSQSGPKGPPRADD